MTEDQFQWVAIFVLSMAWLIHVVGEWLDDRKW